MIITEKRQVVRAELERANFVAVHDPRRGIGLGAEAVDQRIDFITAEFAGRCHGETPVPDLLQYERRKVNFFDAAKAFQSLKLHIDGVSQRNRQSLAACRTFHILLGEITYNSEND